MREILVIRFGALGDLCVLAWALARLRDQPDGTSCRVTLVTKAAFAPLMREMRGIDEVVGLDDSSWAALLKLARQLRGHRWSHVVDAHHTLRSHLLLGLLGRRPAARLAKDTLRRLLLLKGRRADARLTQRMLDRFDNLFARWRSHQAADARPPLSHLRPPAAEMRGIGLAPGAQWDTKRWPQEHYAEVVNGLAGHGPLQVYLGPRESGWYPGSQLATALVAADAEVVRQPHLPDVARSLARNTILVTNDSGLLHLAEAVGTPVVALFGPTVREFGYFPLLPSSRVFEHPLECRPCSRNGKRPCHRGDLACLTAIPPQTVLAALFADSTGGGPT